MKVHDGVNTNSIASPSSSSEGQLYNPHLFISCNGKSSTDQQWSSNLIRSSERTRRNSPLNQLADHYQFGCRSGSWNHICYLYVPLRHPADYFRKATATATGTISAY